MHSVFCKRPEEIKTCEQHVCLRIVYYAMSGMGLLHKRRIPRGITAMDNNMKKELCIRTVKELSTERRSKERFWPRKSVHQWSIQKRAQRSRTHAESERYGPLLWQCKNGKLFCNLKEGKDLQDLRLSANMRSEEKYHFQTGRNVAGCIQRMGEAACDDSRQMRRTASEFPE